MFLSIKKIPKLYWSSEDTFNLRPKPSTLGFLTFGLVLFGLGEGLLIVSTTGNSPWSVLGEGLANVSGLSIGITTFLVSLLVLILWFFVKQKPGVGTIINIVIISLVIDLTIYFFEPPSSLLYQYALAIFAVILVGIGSAFYLVANLGPGPRDGLMTGLTRLTNLPIALVRVSLEITVVVAGWYCGGTVGAGTLIFAFGVGPCFVFSLYLLDKIYS